MKIPSVIGNEKAIADVVEAWAFERFTKRHTVRVSHSLFIGARKDPRPMVLLVGHLDTVPVAAGAPEARIDGDRLIGLGASDMKGALAVMMMLGEGLTLSALPLNVGFVFYEREEGPFQESGLGPLFQAVPEIFRARFAIAMEPTNGAVQVGCVGSLHATLKFEGQAAHSARPWQGRNAVTMAGEILAELHSMERREIVQAGFSFYEVMTATLANGGRARNVVPDSFEVNVNYRFAPGKSVEQAKADVLAFVRDRAKVTFTDLAPSGAVCAENELFRRLVSESGKTAEAKQAWTDVARFAEAGVDAVNFGPGETAQAHQKDESASVSALLESYDVVTRVLTSR